MYGTKKGRKAIIFYASNLRIFELFPEEMQEKMALWVMEYGFEGKMTDCPKDIALALKPILMGIQTQINRHKNIEILSWAIDQIQRKSVNITDKNDAKVMEQAQAMLRKGITRCKKRDVLPEAARTLIFEVLSGSTVKKHLQLPEEIMMALLSEEQRARLKAQGNGVAQPTSRTPRDYGPRVR